MVLLWMLTDVARNCTRKHPDQYFPFIPFMGRTLSSCLRMAVARVTRGWDSASPAAQTTLTSVKTPASSSQRSYLEEQLPRTAG